VTYQRQGYPAPGSATRVNRGGSYNNTAVNARSANRNDSTPTNADNNLGVRPAKASHSQIGRDIHGVPRAAAVMPRPVSRAGGPPGIDAAEEPEGRG